MDNEVRTERAAAPDDARLDEPISVRLSPVEMRNLHLINDPALEGFGAVRTADDELPDGALPPSGGGSSYSSSCDGRYDLKSDAAEFKCECAEPTGISFGCYRYEVTPKGTARLLSYEGDGTRVKVPDEVDFLVVTELGEGLFRSHSEIESVALPSALTRIGAHAFDECSALRHVELPASLEVIESFAFAKSGLESVALPSSVQSLGEKAFFACKELRACVLSPGLREVGNEAFAYSGIQRIVLPPTIERMGFHVLDHTLAQVHATSGAIGFGGRGEGGHDEGGHSEGGCSKGGGSDVAHGYSAGVGSSAVGSNGADDVSRAGCYFVDARGGLYRGDEFVELMSCASAYAVRPGTRRIAARAFCRNGFVRRVELPEGVREIGDEAFYGCWNLRQLTLPDSLEAIGSMALVGTALTTLRIGKSLRDAGEAAFLVQGKSPLRVATSLAHVEIDPENRHFYTESGLLCKRGAGEGGGDLCLLYLGPDNVVRIPQAVNRIASCAFCGTSNIDELFVHGHLHSVCWEALSTVRAIPLVHVQFSQPIDGYDGEDFYVPSLSARYRSMTNLITTDERGTVFNFPYYDAWIAHVSAAEEFLPAAVRRLMRPICLSDRARELYLGILQRKRGKACCYFAKKGDMDALAFLCEARVLDKEDVVADLDRATAERETQATACLLELMRRFGWHAGVDMSL